MDRQKQYIAIDLKSFYASVECVERGLDPLSTNLVVADAERTDKTICLAVSPSLKAFGIGGRARLFEVVQRIRQVNAERRMRAPGACLVGKSVNAVQLAANSGLAVDYLVATPRMAFYLEYSARIYQVYLRFVAPEDIHVYSIDEVFIDATSYLDLYHTTAHDFAMTMMRAVLAETGVTATAGIGTNLYLCKIAMDIMAKRMAPDADGVRIAALDEMTYRRELWDHRPLTDFWRVGRGTMQRLAAHGIHSMGDIARASLEREPLLYKLFGVNAELLIDHAWGWEPVTIPLIKAYRPETHSISSGQVLHCPYTFSQTRNVVLEMAESAALELFEKRLVTSQLVLEIGYDIECLTNPLIRSSYTGKIHVDRYGREVPFHAHGTINLDNPTSLAADLIAAADALFSRITNPDLLMRRITLTCNRLRDEEQLAHAGQAPRQLDLFTDYDELARSSQAAEQKALKQRRMQEAVLRIKKTFGKNSILRGLNFADGATARQRNNHIGGHRK